jgi:hypothetical protein
MSNTLTAIDILVLETVTGGTSKAGSSSSSSATLSALTGIESSLADLKKPAQASAFGGNNLMLFALLAMNRPATTNVVYVGRRRGW